MVSSKYTPGERTSWDTTTRSVPLMMKVPFSVIIGKSPMKTVWLLISPVLLLMNSAVTNSGAAYVMSLSLHSSTGALTSSKRGSENDSDIEPEKSSIGESSASTSSRPPTGLTSPRALAFARQRSEPISHSNDSVCTSRSPGTSRGSRSLAKEIRFGAPGTELLVVAIADFWRDPAKMHPSSTSCEHLDAGLHRIQMSLYLRRFGWPLKTTNFPDARHATRSLSGAQARTSVSGAGLGGQDAASATSNSTAGRHIPQPPHAKVTGRWLASLTRAHMLPNRLARLPPSVKR